MLSHGLPASQDAPSSRAESRTRQCRLEAIHSKFSRILLKSQRSPNLSMPDLSQNLIIIDDFQTAFPFALSRKEAIVHLGPYASKACMFKGIMGSLFARFFGPGWGFTPIQPVRI